MDWITYDISFCASDCTNTECERHSGKLPPGIYTFSDFSKTCDEYKTGHDAEPTEKKGTCMTAKVIVITTDDTVSVREIPVVDDRVSDGLREIVGGPYDIVRLPKSNYTLCMICDDEGLWKKKPINTICSILYGFLEHGSPIVGDVVIMKEGFRNGERDIVGFSDDEAHIVRALLSELLKFIE